MKTTLLVLALAVAAAAVGVVSCSTTPSPLPGGGAAPVARAQVHDWSQDDMDFFLHGSMSTEFVPENVMRSFITAYPDLFPTADLRHLGLVPDAEFGWPVGFSRAKRDHLGGLSSVGINCAACHYEVIEMPEGGSNTSVVVLGGTGHFDAEAFFGSVIGATFRTRDPAAMKKFLAAYLDQCDPLDDLAQQAGRRARFDSQWRDQEAKIAAAMAADPAGAKGAGEGGLQKLDPQSLVLTGQRLDGGVDLAAMSISMLKLFHNMRTAVHVPDLPPAPEKLPPPSGPGRNDAFGLLSAALLGVPQPPMPVKFGLVWNLDRRYWVHWDGNTRSPIGRNLLAVTGLGAPVVGHRAVLDFALVERQTQITQLIAPPKYPLAVDDGAAKRGAALYQASCASCHDSPEGDERLYSPREVGTEPHRAELFTPKQAEGFNKFLSELETPGYVPATQPGIRSTEKYWAASLGGAWARSPYLHNGSVRTMEQLLTPPDKREKTYHRGTRVYDPKAMGFIDGGAYLFDTQTPGNSNAGHDYGTGLSADEKRDLIEYLKSQ